MTVTKKNIASKISIKTNLSKDSSKVFFDKFVNILINESIENGSVKLSNFGVFEYKQTKNRIGRNPKSKKEYIIKPINKLTFRASSHLKNSLN